MTRAAAPGGKVWFVGAGPGAADLLTLEDAAPALKYPRPEVALDSPSTHFFVVSDLHLGAGRQTDASYDGNEHFFADDSFDRLLGTLLSSQRGERSTLTRRIPASSPGGG